VGYRDRCASTTGRRGSHGRLTLPRGLRAAAALAFATALLAAAPNALAASLSSPYGPVYERLRYGPGYRQVTDVFQSASPNSPLVVLVHGGGWRFDFALSQFAPQSKALQAQGFTVFDIQYKPDSETTPAFPMEPNDVMLATRWAIANAASFSADPGKVVLLGGSAGGHLVSLAAEQLDSESPGTVKGVISLSGPMNFTTLLPMIQDGAITNENFITSVEQALGLGVEPSVFASRSEAESYPATWSPALHVPATQNCPNWMLFNSEAELIPLPQAQEMSSNLAKANCKATLNVLPGSKHAFSYFDRVSSAIFSFIRSQ
jgi:acetyl esterase